MRERWMNSKQTSTAMFTSSERDPRKDPDETRPDEPLTPHSFAYRLLYSLMSLLERLRYPQLSIQDGYWPRSRSLSNTNDTFIDFVSLKFSHSTGKISRAIRQ